MGGSGLVHIARSPRRRFAVYPLRCGRFLARGAIRARRCRAKEAQANELKAAWVDRPRLASTEGGGPARHHIIGSSDLGSCRPSYEFPSQSRVHGYCWAHRQHGPANRDGKKKT